MAERPPFLVLRPTRTGSAIADFETLLRASRGGSSITWPSPLLVKD